MKKIAEFWAREAFLAFFLLFAASLAGCQNLPPGPSTQGASGQRLATIEGRMLWHKSPVKRAFIFLTPLGSDGKPSGSPIEFATRTDGRFSENVPPGAYFLKSAPTTMCPVKGRVDLLPGSNRYRLVVHPLSFLTCRKGEIRRL